MSIFSVFGGKGGSVKSDSPFGVYGKTEFGHWVHSLYLFSIGHLEHIYADKNKSTEFVALIDDVKLVFISDEEMFNFHMLLDRLDILDFDKKRDIPVLREVYGDSIDEYKSSIRKDILSAMVSKRNVLKAPFSIDINKAYTIGSITYSNTDKVNPLLYGTRDALKAYILDNLYKV